MPARFFINLAYIISTARLNAGAPNPVLEGGPSWIDSDRYQISAKAEGAVSRDVMNGPMLQALLEERFQLRIHRETREVPIYALTVAKSGLKLHPADGGSCTPRNLTQPSTPPRASVTTAAVRAMKRNQRTMMTRPVADQEEPSVHAHAPVAAS